MLLSGRLGYYKGGIAIFEGNMPTFMRKIRIEIFRDCF